MHLALTDRTHCPRCGPEFGLILLAHEVQDRRVISGDLGCSNCRGLYPVRSGFGDLRAPPRSPLPILAPDGDSTPTDREETIRVGTLLGLTEGPGTLLIRGPAVRFARALAELIGGVEIVALDPSLVRERESEGVSRIAAGPGIPFFSSTFRGVLLSGDVMQGDLEEGARVVSPKGRLVILEAPDDARQSLEALGLKILLDDEGVLVGERETTGFGPLVTLRGL